MTATPEVYWSGYSIHPTFGDSTDMVGIYFLSDTMKFSWIDHMGRSP